jgi:ABC-type glutathione transport system ATPase component
MNQVLSLEAVDLHRYYQVGKGPFKQPVTLRAVAGASFTLAPGKTLAVVGESGCGKSTLARLIAMIELPTSGRLAIDGQDIVGATRSTLRSLRPKVQMVFQDPYGSLNPRKQVGSILEEPLEINTPMAADARRRAARDMMAKVGLRPEILRPLSPHVLRRPAATSPSPARHAAAEGRHRRRAGLGARRVDSRPGPQPAHGPAGGVRALPISSSLMTSASSATSPMR